MKAHDVRNLRACDLCGGLGHLKNFLRTEQTCIKCAFTNAGSIEAFMAYYPREEWEKLPLGLIGADAMRTMIAKIEAGS